MITSVACNVSDVAVADRVCALTTAAFRRWSAVRLPVQLKIFEAIDEEDLKPKRLLGAQLESARDGSHGHSDGIVHGQYVGYFDRDCVFQVENMKQTETGVDFRALKDQQKHEVLNSFNELVEWYVACYLKSALRKV